MMRQTVVILLVTIGLFFGLIIWGVPLLIRTAGLLGEINSSSQPVDRADDLAPGTPQLRPIPKATTEATTDLSGFAETGSTVILYRTGSELARTVSNENGEFSFVGVELLDGENTFYVIAVDGAGNESGQSVRVTTVYDVLAPSLTITSPSNGESFIGENDRVVTVKGETDIGVRVRVNDRLAVVGTGGAFSTTVKLEEGTNTIRVLATDEAGNETESEISVSYTP